MSSGSVARIIGMTAIILLVDGSAFGQFLVQPMKMEVPVRPGRRCWPELIVENTSDTTRVIDLRVVDLTQDPNGLWVAIEPDAQIDASSKLRSCQSWLHLPRDTVQLAPWQRMPLRLRADVPAGTRGYYCAAILAQSLLSPGELEGYTSAVLLEFLIPVIMEAQGRPMRHEIEVTDVGLTFRRQTIDQPAATLVTMDIDNKGGTYSRLNGYLRVWGQWGGHWRKITDAQLPESSIIPTIELKLQQDVGRPLPSGNYKLEGFLFVDGRRASQVSKEFEYKGDPRVMSVQADAAIDLDPRELFIETIPGATRGASIAIVNASEEAVTVDVAVSLPEHMVAAAYGNLRGPEFGCSDWLDVSPKQFNLRGRGRQNLKIISRMPNPAGRHPNYYAMITLNARYPDGQKGGATKARVCLQNKRADSAPRVENTLLTLSESAPGRYLVTARFANAGDTHILPDCQAVLTTFPDGMPRKRLNMSSEAYEQTGIMLPLETRNFTGILDVSDVTAGTYRLTTILAHDKGEPVQGQTALNVVDAGESKEVVVVNVEELGGATKIEL